MSGSTSPPDPFSLTGSALEPRLLKGPLVPLSVCFTLGIILDRALSIPLLASLVACVMALLAWLGTCLAGAQRLALAYLALIAVAIGSAYHQSYAHVFPADDIRSFTEDEPGVVRVRGQLESEPTVIRPPKDQVLRTMPQPEKYHLVLALKALFLRDTWQGVSGSIRVTSRTLPAGLHAGDDVEVCGRLIFPEGPANPGEADNRASFRDQRLRGLLIASDAKGSLVRIARGWTTSWAGWLAYARNWAQGVLLRLLPDRQGELAAVLLLGENAILDHEDWSIYVRTGVIHVLAISGQHLLVLAIFAWWIIRLLGISRSRAAFWVGSFLVGYAILTGLRPPVLRAAVMAGVFCTGLVLRRPILPANGFAAAWLGVIAINPSHAFASGCLLSFLSVAVLYWGIDHWTNKPEDPLERLIERSRPLLLQILRSLLHSIMASFRITFILWIFLAPLVAGRYHVLSLVGLLIGPPVVILSSIALIFGFLLLMAALVWEPLALPFAFCTRCFLAGSDYLVQKGDCLPASHFYLADIPGWWLLVFYVGVLTWLFTNRLVRRWVWVVPVALAWLCVGLLASTVRLPETELRCTFLAVGHGGCTVLETPNGRTLLYDAGALSGPEVTRRFVAPFLWSRGIQRIDEVFLSHADLDHFNGIPELIERFPVGQVTTTPSFADRSLPGVRLTLESLERRGIPVRIAVAGDRFLTEEVLIDVLHPPPEGPSGPENTRSLVLLLNHAHHRILLTGDLEGAGLQRLLTLPAQPVDVLMAPHHGSKSANTTALASWARPLLVVACAAPKPEPSVPPVYSFLEATYLSTAIHGAVCIRSHPTGLVCETFKTRLQFVLPSRNNYIN